MLLNNVREDDSVGKIEERLCQKAVGRIVTYVDTVNVMEAEAWPLE